MDMIKFIGILFVAVLFGGALSACVDPGIDITTPTDNGNEEGMQTFSSEADLREFLEERMSGSDNFGTRGASVAMDSSAESLMAPTPTTKSAQGSSGSSDFSKTNVQVKGIDEADIVKSDGEYMYAVAANKVHIIRAYPPENMQIVSTIEDEEIFPSEIFIYGDKLVILGSESFRTMPVDNLARDVDVASDVARIGIMPMPTSLNSFIKIYDISEKDEPTLDESISLQGSYKTSRMVDGNIYVVFNKYLGRNFELPVV